MHTRLISAIAVAGLTMAACGGGSGGDRGEAVDIFVEAMAEQDIDVDRDCADDIVQKLSDDDIAAIVEAGAGGDASLSDEGDEITAGLLDCVDTSAMVDSMIDDLVAEVGDENVDADCLRDALSGIDLANPDDPAITTAMFDCVSFDG